MLNSHGTRWWPTMLNRHGRLGCRYDWWCCSSFRLEKDCGCSCRLLSRSRRGGGGRGHRRGHRRGHCRGGRHRGRRWRRDARGASFCCFKQRLPLSSRALLALARLGLIRGDVFPSSAGRDARKPQRVRIAVFATGAGFAFSARHAHVPPLVLAKVVPSRLRDLLRTGDRLV